MSGYHFLSEYPDYLQEFVYLVDRFHAKQKHRASGNNSFCHDNCDCTNPLVVARYDGISTSNFTNQNIRNPWSWDSGKNVGNSQAVEEFNSRVVGFAKAVTSMKYEVRRLFLLKMVRVFNNRHSKQMKQKDIDTRHDVLGFPFFWSSIKKCTLLTKVTVNIHGNAEFIYMSKHFEAEIYTERYKKAESERRQYHIRRNLSKFESENSMG